MKYLLFFLFITLSVWSDEIKEIIIAGKSYVIVHESYDEYSDKGIAMKIYKKEQNQDTLPMFSFTLENQSGGCGARSTQEGSYEINGSTITLYSHWDRSGRTYDTPRGDRIQHYRVDANGSVTWVDGLLYIERQAKNYDKESGLKYLFKAPKNEEEKAKLQSYIQRTEGIFKGRFVQGQEAIKLHEKVDKALMQKRKTRWK